MIDIRQKRRVLGRLPDFPDRRHRIRNSAGKTTTIRILATLLRSTGGTVRVLGRDAAAVRKLVSLTGQFAYADADPDRR